ILERLNKNNYGEKVSEKVYQIIFDHISKWGDIDDMVGAGELGYFSDEPQYDGSLLLWKGKLSGDVVTKHLEWLKNTLSSTQEDSFSSSEKIKSIVFDYATENGRGDVLWPLRVALSGKEKSPDPFTLLYILGKDATLKRIDSAIKKI
ncbi:MAG: hypothetical protein ABL899_01640, partial [Nitrospira sp.]